MYPVESSSVIFHFTNQENLLGILKNNFLPKWGLEDLTCILPGSPDAWTESENYIYAFPKVCFCDIPLSRVAKHMSRYDNYGIGLTKDWAKLNGINPVIYVNSGSRVAEAVFGANKYLESSEIAHSNPLAEEEAASRRLELATKLYGQITINKFTKPYEGPFGENDEIVRYYDEREWRYVPPYDPKQVQIYYKNVFESYSADQIAELNNSLGPLVFEPNDIRYLIVRSEGEILPLMDRLPELKSRYDSSVIRLLTSRILAADNIKQDV